MTPEQMRMARSLLDLKQSEVAEAIGVSVQTLSPAESGKTSMDKAEELKAFYEQHGIEFLDFDGVRRKPTGSRMLRGREGFRELYDLLYETAKNTGGDIWLYNGVSELVMGALGAEKVQEQKDRMMKIKNNYRYRVIVEEGDNTFFGADYCDYKWLSSDNFNDSTIFVFGSYIANVNFDNNIEVNLIDNQKFADSQRFLFSRVWKRDAVNPDE